MLVRMVVGASFLGKSVVQTTDPHKEFWAAVSVRPKYLVLEEFMCLFLGAVFGGRGCDEALR